MQERKSQLFGLARSLYHLCLCIFIIFAFFWVFIAVGEMTPLPPQDFPLIASFSLLEFGEAVLTDYMEKHGKLPDNNCWSSYYQAISDLSDNGKEKRALTSVLEEKYTTTLVVEYIPASGDIYISCNRKTHSGHTVFGGYRISISDIIVFRNGIYCIEKHANYIHLSMAIHFGENNFSQLNRFLERLRRRISRNKNRGEFLIDPDKKGPNGELLYITTISRKVKIPAEILGRMSLP